MIGRKRYLIGGGLFVLALTLAGCQRAADSPIEPVAAEAVPPIETTEEAESPPAAAESGYQEGFTEQGEPFKGDPAAPVVIEEFSSYQCPFCGRFFQESYPQITANYVETGQVLYIFRDFPISSQPQSSLAAEAANCAGQTGGGSAYWAMHDRLLEQQREWSGRGNADAIFKGYAEELGLDTATFGECLDSGATSAQVEADVAEGSGRGVRSTPTFFINGYPLVGAQPYETFQYAISLAEQGKLGEAYQQQSSPPPTEDSTLKLAAVSELSPDIQQLSPEVQEAYRFALANPDVLDKIPCYCGCGGVGHLDNRMCYVQSEAAAGQVVFDDHAAG